MKNKLGVSYCKKCGKTTNPPRCKCNQVDTTKILGPNPCGSDYEILDELIEKQKKK